MQKKGADSPLVVLSVDYELFFGRSGTIEKCLFEPSDAILRVAGRLGSPVTFYVDAGMLCRMQALAKRFRQLSGDLDRIRRHLGAIVGAGHDIGLHVHPHWEDTRFIDGQWSFDGTRYQLRQFPDDEAADIVRRYAHTLGEACGVAAGSYRAGGFCVEPFERISPALLSAGIDVDSSVVPGACLNNDAKGFDFRNVPRKDWWLFRESPSIEAENGTFVEIPVTAQRLPFLYYWRRLIERVVPGVSSGAFGDGEAKRVGRSEVLKRLLGASRIAEASIDDPKAGRLQHLEVPSSGGSIYHIMGHPKNVSHRSLLLLENMLRARSLRQFASVSGVARMIRAGGRF